MQTYRLALIGFGNVGQGFAQILQDDAEKLSQRIINEAQSGTTSLIQGFNLKQSLRDTKEIELKIKEGLVSDHYH